MYTAVSPRVRGLTSKCGELRLCVDDRGINTITKKNHYPLPLFDDLLERVQGCCVFVVLDLKNTFNLIASTRVTSEKLLSAHTLVFSSIHYAVWSY